MRLRRTMLHFATSCDIWNRFCSKNRSQYYSHDYYLLLGVYTHVCLCVCMFGLSMRPVGLNPCFWGAYNLNRINVMQRSLHHTEMVHTYRRTRAIAFCALTQAFGATQGQGMSHRAGTTYGSHALQSAYPHDDCYASLLQG